jgi:hypothetical protein
MTMTPPTPTTVEPGQIWRDNDQRTKGAGEFVVLAVTHADGTVDQVPGLGVGVAPRAKRVIKSALHWPEEYAIVRRSETGRFARILVDRLLSGANTQRGYTYLGTSR